MKQTKIPGVLGGMGPEATIDFMSRMLRTSPAREDQDHLHLLIDHNPQVPNRHAAIAGDGEAVGVVLAAMAQRLEHAGADFLVMVCNTAHAFQSHIERAVSIPFLSMIDMLLGELSETYPGVKNLGLMAADGCLDARLYQQAATAKGYHCMEWCKEERQEFMHQLYRIKSGVRDKSVQASLLVLAESLQQQGAEVLICGCTEIPLIVGANDFTIPWLSSTDVLVRHTRDYALGLRALPD